MHAFILRIRSDELRDFLAIAKPDGQAKLPPGVSEEELRVRLRQEVSRGLSIKGGASGDSPERIDRILKNANYWQKVVAKCIAKLPPDLGAEDFQRQLRQELSAVLSLSPRGNDPERIDRIL